VHKLCFSKKTYIESGSVLFLPFIVNFTFVVENNFSKLKVIFISFVNSILCIHKAPNGHISNSFACELLDSGFELEMLSALVPTVVVWPNHSFQ